MPDEKEFMGGAFNDLFFRAVAPSSHDLDIFFAEAFCRFAAVAGLKVALMEAGFSKEGAQRMIESWKQDQISLMEARLAEDGDVKEAVKRFGAEGKLKRLFKSRLNVFVKASLRDFFSGFPEE